MYIKTDILLDDSGKEFDLGRARKYPVWIKTLSKEEALDLFDKGKVVYFVYENNRIYRVNCRKVCTNRYYLTTHYSLYHEPCGVLAKTVELCTFPKDDNDYCHSFTVPQEWLVVFLSTEKKKIRLKDFLENYTWDETYFMYESAKRCGVLLEEEVVH